MAVAILLISNPALGLSSISSTKMCGTSNARRLSISQYTGAGYKVRSNNGNGIGGVDNRYNWGHSSNTRLTSTYIEARHKPKPSLLSIPSLLQKRAQRWTANVLQRKTKRSLIIGASTVFLAMVVLFGPTFSPAAYAAEIAATSSSAVSSSSSSVVAAAGLSPVNLPLKSHALGSCNILPTKAELELCFRLLYAACSGAFVGLERSSSDRPAGVRTMALVGLGACIYTICSIHGFHPATALGYLPGSPMLANVKVDLSRMAASIASGVGFIGAGAIHKSKEYGNGTDAQNGVAGLTTAAAIWVSAAVGIASAVGLYFVGAVATFSTVAILKYARLPSKDDEEPGFSWNPKELEVVEDEEPRISHEERVAFPSSSRMHHQDIISGITGKNISYDPIKSIFVEHDDIEETLRRPIITREVIDVHREPEKVRIEEEIEVEWEEEIIAFKKKDKDFIC